MMRSDFMKELPYVVHTNMELGLMLRGKKPLARFVHEGERTPNCILRYLRMFDRHVASGRFVKHESLMANAGGFDLRRIMYALPGEEWRFEKMNDLLARPGQWNADREREEGELFGYENWMNDLWLARYPVKGP